MTPIVYTYLLAAGIAFVSAQSIKFLLNQRLAGTGWRQLFMSGRMPSAHTSTVFALVTAIAVQDGFDSGLFAVAAVFATLTAYDSMMSRRSSGEQGLALKQLLEKSSSMKGPTIPVPHIALGHTPLEVLAGGLLGISVGILVVFFIT